MHTPYDSIVSAIIDMEFFIDAVSGEGKIVFWNNTACRLTGYTASRICTEPEPWAVLYPDDAYRRELFVNASKKGWDLRGCLWYITRRDGVTLPLIISVFAVHTLLNDLGATKMAVGVPAPSPDSPVDILSDDYNRKFEHNDKIFRLFSPSTPRRMAARNLCLTLRHRLIALDAWLAQ